MFKLASANGHRVDSAIYSVSDVRLLAVPARESDSYYGPAHAEGVCQYRSAIEQAAQARHTDNHAQRAGRSDPE